MKKTAKELDELFDRGEDMTPYMDMSSIRRPNLETKRVNIDFPQWVVRRLDQQSKLLGVTRQALVKMWIAERLEKV
jgi:hypothetical protein